MMLFRLVLRKYDAIQYFLKLAGKCCLLQILRMSLDELSPTYGTKPVTTLIVHVLLVVWVGQVMVFSLVAARFKVYDAQVPLKNSKDTTKF